VATNRLCGIGGADRVDAARREIDLVLVKVSVTTNLTTLEKIPGRQFPFDVLSVAGETGEGVA